MLKRLTTKNFRKLTDNTFTFGPGLQVVRGSNEAGKSTMLEAIGYALFGIKACRESLAETVTWGQPERTLQVELVMEIDGIEYTVKRAKSGAEVNYAGGRVVGQSEVSAFVERLLGTDTGNAAKLMLASQGSIRGALEQGPKAAMELIEELSDFQVIDRVVELIQANCLTGPTTAAEQRLAQAVKDMEVARAGVEQAPDTDRLECAIGDLAESIRVDQRKIDETVKPAFEKAQNAVLAAEELERQRQDLQAKKAAAQAQVDHYLNEQKKAASGAEGAPTPGAIAKAREAVVAARSMQQELATFTEFSKLGYPEDYWEGDRASLEKELATQEAAAAAALAENGATNTKVQVLEASRVTGTACGYCGKDLMAVPEVKAKNDKINADIAALRKEMKVSHKAYYAAAGTVEALKDVLKAAPAFELFAAKHADKLAIDKNFVPWRLAWTGLSVSGGITIGVRELEAELNRLEAAQRAADAAAGRAKALGETAEGFARQAAALNGNLTMLPAPADMAALKAELAKLQLTYNKLAGDVAEAKQKKVEAEAELRVLLETRANAERLLASAKARHAATEHELRELEFNNALVKRVRAARPIIADRLWTIVLAAVSTYFSAMRGEKSAVTREGNDFKVDGRSIGGLSGSTLDILGLAIRLALTRTFLPTTPLLVLDEPAAAMDEGRTSAMLGFLVAAEFKQTLLVTHEEMSESVANNLITI